MDGWMDGVYRMLWAHKRMLIQQWGYQKHNISDVGWQLISVLFVLSFRKFRGRY